MRLIVPHKKTRAEVIQSLDKGIDGLFAGAVGSSIEIVNSKKEWVGSTLHFSFTTRLGFISLPINGTVDVDDTNATLDVELPSLVKNFIGEDRVAANIEKRVQALLGNGRSTTDRSPSDEAG
jgi:hypothetical protein